MMATAESGAGRPPVTDVMSAVCRGAELHPDRPAISDLRRELTYSQLVDEVARAGAGLVSLGVGPGDRVGLLIGNSVDFVVAALACMCAGAAFAPIAVSDPAERQAAIVRNCAPRLIVTVGADRPSALGAPEVDLEQLRGGCAVPATKLCQVALTEPGTAYCMYTSGTTGSPKGVMIGRSAFATAVAEIGRCVGAGASTRALCVSPVHGDGSFSLVFTTLYWGGYLVIPDRSPLLFHRTYFATLRRNRINSVSFSPSFLRLLIAGGGLGAFADTDVEVLVLGGEAPTCAEVRSIWDANPAIRVFNRYGPTETTISVSDLELSPQMLDLGYVPIGAPHDGTSFHLLAADGGLVTATDVTAELHIGGQQLMDGYWGAAQLTSSVLRSDLIAGELLYRTGDLLRLDEHGRYAFVGRVDRIIKHRAERVSLDELTEQLSQIDGVLAAAVVSFDDAGVLGIAAFVITEPGTAELDVRSVASERLPAAMLPDLLLRVDEFPLTGSGKVDEPRLLAAAGLTGWAPVSLDGPSQ